MHSRRDNIEIMIIDKVDKVIKDLFDSLKNRYQNSSKLMKGNWLHYKCHKVNPSCGGLYIFSPDWIKNKKNNKSHE